MPLWSASAWAWSCCGVSLFGHKIIFLPAFSLLLIAFYVHTDQAAIAGITKSCMHCQSHPCLWNIYSEQIMHEVLIFENSQEEKSRFRFRAYQAFVKMHHGMLGRFHRVEIPKCVLTGIRMLWPDKNNNYIGHRDAEQGSKVD